MPIQERVLTHTREDSHSLHKTPKISSLLLLHDSQLCQDRDQLGVRGRAGHGLPRHRSLLHQGREVIHYSRIQNIFMCIYKYFIKYHVSPTAVVSVLEQYKCLFLPRLPSIRRPSAARTVIRRWSSRVWSDLSLHYGDSWYKLVLFG